MSPSTTITSTRAGALLAGLLGILLLGGCLDTANGDASSGAKAEKRKTRTHLVRVITLKSARIRSTHERTGTLRHRRLVRIYNQEEGRLVRMPWFEGDKVAKGELMAQIDDALIRAELAKAIAETKQARLDLKRITNLVKKRAASQDELARAQTALLVARAQERLQRTRLGYTRILSPMDGVISTRSVEQGDVLAKHTHILTLHDPSSLIVHVKVSELIMPHLRNGDPVRISIDALGGEPLRGRIVRIHPELDQLTRQGVIEVGFDTLPRQARAGQFARVRLTSARSNRKLVPFTALRRDREGEFVYVLDGKKAKRVPVRSGLRLLDQVEILSGPGPGDQVVTAGFLGLSDGTLVKVAKAKG